MAHQYSRVGFKSSVEVNEVNLSLSYVGVPTIQVEYRPIVHWPSCSRKTGGLSCLCGSFPSRANWYS